MGVKSTLQSSCLYIMLLYNKNVHCSLNTVATKYLKSYSVDKDFEVMKLLPTFLFSDS